MARTRLGKKLKARTKKRVKAVKDFVDFMKPRTPAEKEMLRKAMYSFIAAAGKFAADYAD